MKQAQRRSTLALAACSRARAPLASAPLVLTLGRPQAVTNCWSGLHARLVSSSSSPDPSRAFRPEEEAYFADLVGNAPVRVQPVGWSQPEDGRSQEAKSQQQLQRRGPGGRTLPSKGLFARARIEVGQCVLVEAPLVAAPSFARPNAFEAWQSRGAWSSASGSSSWVMHEEVCGHCLKSLVGPSEAIPPPDRENPDYQLPLVERKTPVFWPTATRHNCDGCEDMQKHGAYEQTYCSQTCKEAARSEHHNRLCPSNDSTHPFVTYQRIARELENPFLIQVARLYAKTVQLFNTITPKRRFEDVWQLSPVAKFSSSYDVVPLFESASMARAKRFIYGGEGVALLKQALHADTYPELFTSDTFAWIYNIVHMNCSAIHPKSPWEVYASNIQKIRPVQSLKVVVEHIMNLAEVFARKYELSEEERSQTIFHLLSRSGGNGLYVLHSCMNHSCDPNIEVRNQETNANVHLLAKRAIQPGEELCIDYAQFQSARWQHPQEEGKTHSLLPSRDQRQQFLWRTFGFRCCCPRCQAEDRASA